MINVTGKTLLKNENVILALKLEHVTNKAPILHTKIVLNVFENAGISCMTPGKNLE